MHLVEMMAFQEKKKSVSLQKRKHKWRSWARNICLGARLRRDWNGPLHQIFKTTFPCNPDTFDHTQTVPRANPRAVWDASSPRQSSPGLGITISVQRTCAQVKTQSICTHQCPLITSPGHPLLQGALLTWKMQHLCAKHGKEENSFLLVFRLQECILVTDYRHWGSSEWTFQLSPVSSPVCI